MIVRHPRSLECVDSRTSVTTGDIQEPERPDGLVDQDPVQPAINLAMVEIVVVDKLAIELPLLLKKTRCQIVIVGKWVSLLSLFPPDALNGRRLATCCGNFSREQRPCRRGRRNAFGRKVLSGMAIDAICLFGVKGNVWCAALVVDGFRSAV